MRWWGLFGLGLLVAGCGGSSAVVVPADQPGELFEAVRAPDVSTPTTVPAPPPSPTPRPSSRESFLVPAPWAPAPVRMNSNPVPAVEAASALILDEASGTILWERSGEISLAPASLTKIATAIVAIEDGNLNRVVQVDVDHRTMPSSTVMGLLPGDTFTLQDLLYGLMLPSGNDAAIAIGRAVAGSDGAFVTRMNALMIRLGLVESHFANPHGLGAPGHEMSAYDLAALTRYAMTFPKFRELATAESWVARGSRTLSMWNLNAFVGDYPGGDGVKVGYTRRAGRTLVASATRNGHRVIVVLLNAPNSQVDAKQLMDWSFANHAWPNR